MVQRLTPRYMHVAGAAMVALNQGTDDDPATLEHIEKKLTVVPYYWNPDTLAFEVGRQGATGASTGGGGAGSTTVDANLTSAGSTKEVGYFRVANPTTTITVDGTVSVSSGEVTLSSAGSTRLVGQVTVSNPTTSVNVANPTTAVNVANPTTSVTVTSGVVLGAGSSANVLGAVAQGAGSTSLAPWYVISSAGGGGSTSVDVSNQPTVLPGSGSSAVAPWVVDGMRFSSGQSSFSTVATSAEAQLLAANANRRAAVIANLSTATNLLLGFTTAVVSTARANCHYILPANGKVTIGGQLGDLPLYLGPIRGRLDSTTLAGVAALMQFTS